MFDILDRYKKEPIILIKELEKTYGTYMPRGFTENVVFIVVNDILIVLENGGFSVYSEETREYKELTGLVV